MHRISLSLTNGLPADVAREIAKRACYCDKAIMTAAFEPSLNSLEVTVSDEANIETLRMTLERLIRSMETNRLRVVPKVLWERKRRNDIYDLNVSRELEESSQIRQIGPGVIARSGNFAEVIRILDNFLERIGKNLFTAETHDYNVLIPADWLRKASYFTSFPHSLTFAFHLKESLQDIETFADRHKDGRTLTLESITEIETPEYCLSPAVCYHTYGSLSGRVLGAKDAGFKTITAMNRCFRFESKNMHGLDRLWEFSMREIVFVGESARVMEQRIKSLECIKKWIEILDLTATIETASDPFFATDFRSLRFFQLANELKFELRMPVDNASTIAVASFNYHDSFFGDRFGITMPGGDFAHTGCAAFGLDRLALAILAQIGLAHFRERMSIAETAMLGND